MLVVQGLEEAVRQARRGVLVVREEGGSRGAQNAEKVVQRHVPHVRIGVIEFGEQGVDILLDSLSVRHGEGPRTRGDKGREIYLEWG